MRFGKREPRSSNVRNDEACRPKCEGLEKRLLMAIDLSGVTPPAIPQVATKQYGVQFAGTAGGLQAGSSVAVLGDVNGDSYQDMLFGQPGPLATFVGNTTPNFVTGGAFLAFGSRTVANGNNPLWANLAADQNRVGTANQLGDLTGQTSPVGPTPPTPIANAYDGVQFLTNETNDGLGASVANAGVIQAVNPPIPITTPNPSGGKADFLIGAPGANRAYLVYGSQALAGLGATGLAPVLNLDAPPANLINNVITFTGVNSGQLLTRDEAGRTVAGVGDILGDGSPDIAIADPTVANADGSFGAIYLISSNSLLAYVQANGNTVPLGLVGSAALPGVVLTVPGNSPTEVISISPAGDFDKDGHQDLLVGIPGNNPNSQGAAYLIYGGPAFTTAAAALSPTNVVPLNKIGNPANASTPIPGAVFTGSSLGEHAGYSVGVAATYQGFSEILVGSPGFNNNQGKVTMIYGGLNNLGQANLPANRILGMYALNSTNQITSATFTAEAAPANAGQTEEVGYSIATTYVNSAQTVDIAIGAPGEKSSTLASGTGGQGAVFVIPIAAATSGTLPFASGTFPLNVTPAATNIEKLYNGLIVQDTNGTATPTLTNNVALGAALSGITPLQFFTTAGNTLFGDLKPDLVIGAPLDSTGDLPAAGSPSNQSGSAFAIDGSQLPTIPGSGGGGGSSGGGGTVSISVATHFSGQFYPVTIASTPFGPDEYVPPPSALSQLDYQAIPRKRVYKQFLPTKAFTERTLNYFYPNKYHFQTQHASREHNEAHGTLTLGTAVFTRSVFKKQKAIAFTHKVPVIPTNRQSEVYPGSTLPKT